MSFSVSWSKWKTFDECKLQYHLRYSQRVSRPKSRLTYLVGSVVHDVVHRWAQAGFPSGFIPSNIQESFNKYAAGITFVDPTKRAELFQKSVRGALLTENIYRRLFLPEHHAIIENKFDLPLVGDVKLTGSADVYDSTENGSVYDLKMYTSQFGGDKRQLLVYALAMRLQGHPVARVGFITPFLKPMLRPEPVTDGEINEFSKTFMRGVGEMQGEYSPEPTTGDHCFFCEYNRTPLCPATNIAATTVEGVLGGRTRDSSEGEGVAEPSSSD